VAARFPATELRFGFNKSKYGLVVVFNIEELCYKINKQYMKIVVTGSLGNISKPLAQSLIEKGHKVTVISSKAERQKDIEALGAKAAIGSVNDIDFLANTFKGADIVYLMEPGDYSDFFDPNLDFIASKTAIGENYKKAVEISGVKKIVHLSSNGAEMAEGNGILLIHYNVENILRSLPADVDIKFIRAASFFQNVFYFMETIKSHDAIFANYQGTEKEPWVSTLDIADTIVSAMESPFQGREVQYIASEELTPLELTKLLAEALGKPKIDWVVVSDEQMLDSMVSTGMNPKTVKLYVEMTASRRDGSMFNGYYQNGPAQLGKRKLKDFINEVFVPAFNA
jgi:uncharacterized protein YbjT (DUF2867 family)